jgi:hypothetical protein
MEAPRWTVHTRRATANAEEMPNQNAATELVTIRKSPCGAELRDRSRQAVDSHSISDESGLSSAAKKDERQDAKTPRKTGREIQGYFG